MFVFILFFYDFCFSTINPQQVNQYSDELSEEPTYNENNYRELRLFVSSHINEFRNLIYDIILKNDFGKLQNDVLRALESHFINFTQREIYNILRKNRQHPPSEKNKIISQGWYNIYNSIKLDSAYCGEKLREFFIIFFEELEAFLKNK